MARLAALTEEHFDLEKAPLFKTRLFKLSPDEHVLFFMPHHIVFDGWSFDLLYDEMSALYSAFCAGKPNPLTELPVSYGDFAAWHAQWMQTPEYAAQLSYWLKRLERAGSLEQLPTDKPRHAAMSGEGSTDWMSIDVARTQRLHEIARSMGTTVFVVTLAVYTALLHGYAGHRRFAIGTPVRGRNALELEPIMGYFTNLVLLHLEVDPAGSFTKLVEHVKVVVGESFQNADVPLDAMAREHSIVKSAAGSTLYQALFSFQDGRQRIRRWGELEHEMVLLFQRGATEDLGMWFLESPKGLRGGVTYDTGLFTSETARALKEGYAALLDVALAGPEGSVERIVAEAGIKRGKATAAVAPKPRSAPAAPGTESEKLLAGIWREKLKLEGVGVGDNFFDLGGHSLLAMQAILAMEERTGKRVDRSRYIFETLGQIARAYDEAPAAQPAAKPGALRGLFSGILGKRKG
jgi:hypothetical protein